MQINEKTLIEGLSYALDAAEKTHFSHSKHVAYISLMLARELGMTIEEKTDLYFAALLHDIGVSNTYQMYEHCKIGKEIILKLPLKSEIADYIYYHHEFYNGTGVFKLSGADIPVASQIICLANFFDLKFSHIRYLDLETKEKIVEWIEQNKRLHNPVIIDAFYRIIDKEYILLDYFNGYERKYNKCQYK